VKTLAGIVIVALHIAAFGLLAVRCKGTELTLDVTTLEVPAAIAARAEKTTEHEPPGLVRDTWTVRYRGGYERTIGAARLVGPFQDPAARACTGRVVVGQRMLDALAPHMEKLIESELRGLSFVGIGDFKRVDKLTLRWAELSAHPEDKRIVSKAPNGYVRATARVVFHRVDVPVTVVMLPVMKPDKLDFDIRARAELQFDNGFVQWVSDKVRAEKLATKFTNREIDRGIVTALQPPPPFDLGDGTLTFIYCDGAAQIVEGQYGALPFGVMFGGVSGESLILPPKRGPAEHKPIDANAPIAIDLDLDAMNALLFELWRTGYLDRRLAAAGLDRRFNTDPIVTELLSVRISAPRLALPPVLAPSARGMRLSADARVTIEDNALETVGRVWGGLDFVFAAASSVDLGALELSCERTPAMLVPCYADLINAIRDRGDAFHGELTQSFAALLNDIFVDRRLSDSALPVDLVIKRASPSTLSSSHNASLHLDLDAELVAKP
jgi:hypothetical protein